MISPDRLSVHPYPLVNNACSELDLPRGTKTPELAFFPDGEQEGTDAKT